MNFQLRQPFFEIELSDICTGKLGSDRSLRKFVEVSMKVYMGKRKSLLRWHDEEGIIMIRYV